MTDSTPGWQADPTGKHDHRYWDGSQWTDNVSDAGVAGMDPYAADADATVADADADAPAALDTPAAPEPPAPVEPTVVDAAPPAPDPTAAWPAAPIAPGSPTPPPPYVPSGPVSSGGGGSKRGLLVGGGILAAIAIAVIAFLALGGDDDETSDVRAQLASALRRDTDLSDRDAECVADFFVDDLGEDAFEGVDFNAADPPEELQSAFVESGIKAVEECDLDASAFGTDGTDTTGTTKGPSDGGDGSYGSNAELDALYDDCADGDFAACDALYQDSPAGSEYEEFADTCGERNEPSGFCVDLYESGGDADGGELPDDYAELLEQSLGITQEQAECLTDQITRAIEDGDATPEDAAAGIMDYLSECDISLEEIGSN
jgi:hypothetical protein